MIKRVLAAFLFVAVVSMPLGCGGLSLKAAVHQVHMTAHGALVILNDAEKDLCQPDPAKVNHCRSGAITDAQHQTFSDKMIAAATADQNFGRAMLTWDPVQPMPKDLPDLVAIAGKLLQDAQGFAPSLTAKANALLAQVLDLIQKFVNGGK